MRQTVIDGRLEANVTRLKVQKSTFLGKAIKAEASSGPSYTQYGKYEWWTTCKLWSAGVCARVFVQFIGAEMLTRGSYSLWKDSSC